MHRTVTFSQFWRGVCLALALAAAALVPAGAVLADDAVTFTVDANSLLGRSVPESNGRILASLFKGQMFPVTSRTGDNAWLQIDVGGAVGRVWIASRYGTVRGDLAGVPIWVEPPSPTAQPTAENPDPGTSNTGSGGTGTGGGTFPPTKVKFTVTYKGGLNVRSGPSTTTRRLGAILKGQTFAIRARTSASNWLLIDYPGASEAWVWRYAGDISGGQLTSVPVAASAAAAGPAATATAPIAAPGTQGNPLGFTITSLTHARQIYAQGRKLGRNEHAFSRVGDSNAETTAFLSDFDGSGYNLGSFGHLQDAINQFHGSFARTGAAVQGFTTWGILDKAYADPRLCDETEGALACEFRFQNPAVALVMIGTNDVWAKGAVPSELYLRQIIQAAVNRGIVPVMSTIAWNPDSSYYQSALAMNTLIRKIAAEQNVPLWDFYQSVQSLPNRGIGSYSWDPHAHLSDQPGGNAYFFDEPYLQAGMTRHNLEALQALYTIYKNVIAP